MAKLSLVKGTTSYRAYVFIGDSSVSTGAGKTGLSYNTSSLTAYYVRPGAAATAITLATQTATGAYSSGGFVEVDGTNMPGIYRLDVPDAALATGVNAVVIMLKGATNMAPCVLEIELTGVDNQDATRYGLSALPNAAAAATGGLPTVDSAGAVKVQSGTGANQISLSSGLVRLSSAGVGDIWDESLTGATHNVANSSGRRLRSLSTIASVDSSINDSSATASSFVTALTSTTDDFYNDQLLIFTSGALSGQSRPITSYSGSTKTMTFTEAFTSAPSNGDTFTLRAEHIHPVTQIADGILDRTAGVETGYTLRQTLRIMAAALAGRLSGAATTTITIRDMTNSKARITATVDADGNRSVVTLDGT